MSLFDNDCGCGNVSPESTNNCTGCVCDQLRKLRAGDTVDLIIDGQDNLMNLTFACLDNTTCCATFLDEDYPLIIDCRKIEGIRILS